MPKPKKDTARAPVVEDPENLPSWTPVIVPTSAPPAPVEEEEDLNFDSTFDRDFHSVLDPRFGPEEEHLLTTQAIGVMRIAKVLATARLRVDHYIGELAVAVEDFGIWKYHPDHYQSASEFWADTNLSPSVIKNAIQLYRHGLPVAEQLGVDLKTPSLEGELTRAKAQAVTEVAKIAKKQGLMETQEGQNAVREQMETVLALPNDGQVHTYLREIKGKPERVPCYLNAKVYRDEFDPPKLKGRFELTLEQIEAWESGALYFVVQFGDRTLQPHEVSEVLRTQMPAKEDDDPFANL